MTTKGRHHDMLDHLCLTANTLLAMLPAPELFPTPVRSFTSGVVAAVGRVGGAVSPFLLGAGGLAATFVAMGVANMAAGLLVLLLPETMGARVCRTSRPGLGRRVHGEAAEVSRWPSGLLSCWWLLLLLRMQEADGCVCRIGLCGQGGKGLGWWWA